MASFTITTSILTKAARASQAFGKRSAWNPKTNLVPTRRSIHANMVAQASSSEGAAARGKAKEAVQLGTEAASQTGQSAKNIANSTTQDVSQKAKDVASKVSETAQDVTQKAKEKVQSVWESAKDTAQKAKDTAVNEAEASKEFVKENAQTVQRNMNSKNVK